MPVNGQAYRAGWGGNHAQIRLTTGLGVHEQQLIASDLLELRIGLRRQCERTVWEAPRHLAAWCGLEYDLLRFAAPASGAGRSAVIAVQRDVLRQQEAARPPVM